MEIEEIEAADAAGLPRIIRVPRHRFISENERAVLREAAAAAGLPRIIRNRRPPRSATAAVPLAAADTPTLPRRIRVRRRSSNERAVLREKMEEMEAESRRLSGEGCGRCRNHPKPTRKQSATQKKRHERLKKLMKATGMSLPQASHWLKVNGY